MKDILWVIIVVCSASICSAQKFSTLKADFSILEKNTLIDSSYIVIGSLSYDLYSDLAIYSIDFPSRSYYEFQDSIRIIYDSIHTEVKRDTIGMMNETFVFKKILSNKLSDFDLKSAGFIIVDVIQQENGVVFEYEPPQHISFVSKVYLQKIDNQISGIIFIDENGKQFNKTFYEDYIYEKDLAVPTRIKSQFIGKEQEVFKELQLRNVTIE